MCVQIWVGKPEWKTPLERPTCRLEDKIKHSLNGVGQSGLDLFGSGQSICEHVNGLPVPEEPRDFLTTSATTNFSRPLVCVHLLSLMRIHNGPVITAVTSVHPHLVSLRRWRAPLVVFSHPWPYVRSAVPGHTVTQYGSVLIQPIGTLVVMRKLIMNLHNTRYLWLWVNSSFLYWKIYEMSR
jgi:hypothetical protein